MTVARRKEVHMFLSSKEGLLDETKEHLDYKELTDLMTYNDLLINVFGLIEDGYGEMIVLDSMRRYSDKWSTKSIRQFKGDLYGLQNQFELNRVEGRTTFSLDWVLDELKKNQEGTTHEEEFTVPKEKVDIESEVEYPSQKIGPKERIAVLNYLGVIDLINNKYQDLGNGGNANRIAQTLQDLGIGKRATIQPYIRDIILETTERFNPEQEPLKT